MAMNCKACDDLKTLDANMVVNGWNETNCASFKNDTGLNPSSGHDDCTDLELMNDCLIGNMDEEVELHEVCDWKTFMHDFILNLHTMFNAVRCGICGLWTNVHNLWNSLEQAISNINTAIENINTAVDNINTELSQEEGRTDNICELVQQIMNPQLIRYGTLPLATDPDYVARRCGITFANTSAVPEADVPTGFKQAQNIGIRYGRKIITDCNTGANMMYEWIIPDTFYYKLTTVAAPNTAIWSCTKEEALNVIGMSEYLWNVFETSSWTWRETALTPSRQIAWFKIAVGDGTEIENGKLGIVFEGCTAPNDSFSADQNMAVLNPASARCYTHAI